MEFQSELVSDLYKDLGIRRLRTTAYRPQCDGLVERLNRTLVNIVSNYVENKGENWDNILPMATFAYNTAVQESTKYAPFYLMFGRDAREPAVPDITDRTRSVIDPEDTAVSMWREALRLAKENIMSAQEIQMKHYNRNSHVDTIKVGDLVLLRVNKEGKGKFENNYAGPFKVLDIKIIISTGIFRW